VTALVGPNGAGKTTLLHLAVGLTTPTVGAVRVLGHLTPGSSPALADVAFLAQDAALYSYLSVADTIRLAANLNDHFDASLARQHLDGLGIPPNRRVGTLSGGQQAQVALAITLARRPQLLILDEPVARLDPLARHDVMATLMAVVAEDGLSVVLSSHVVAELERVCDYLVVLAEGGVQVAGDVEALLAEHHVLTGPAEHADRVAAAFPVVREWRAQRETTLLIRAGEPPRGLSADWQRRPTSLEELVLSYLRAPQASALPGLRMHARVGA
jgi:ABC-2 type transport system ATP-binding protein